MTRLEVICQFKNNRKSWGSLNCILYSEANTPGMNIVALIWIFTCKCSSGCSTLWKYFTNFDGKQNLKIKNRFQESLEVRPCFEISKSRRKTSQRTKVDTSSTNQQIWVMFHFLLLISAKINWRNYGMSNQNVCMNAHHIHSILSRLNLSFRFL